MNCSSMGMVQGGEDPARSGSPIDIGLTGRTRETRRGLGRPASEMSVAGFVDCNVVDLVVMVGPQHAPTGRSGAATLATLAEGRGADNAAERGTRGASMR